MDTEVAKKIMEDVENRHEEGLKIILLENSHEALNEQSFWENSDTPLSPILLLSTDSKRMMPLLPTLQLMKLI